MPSLLACAKGPTLPTEAGAGTCKQRGAAAVAGQESSITETMPTHASARKGASHQDLSDASLPGFCSQLLKAHVTSGPGPRTTVQPLSWRPESQLQPPPRPPLGPDLASRAPKIHKSQTVLARPIATQNNPNITIPTIITNFTQQHCPASGLAIMG
uniref:Uncharacterized protein n=1 Tax=Eutreptiella gymnastica TaxID=73025 RepID=A0A7S1J6P1_9EUGL|mmetsp:Transcript_7115/g.12556  ORF Transcript_7115/g.12556 Transcript_7115/m.12556 type:complete len:156 (+) Transcript_7115:29-496(+)